VSPIGASAGAHLRGEPRREEAVVEDEVPVGLRRLREHGAGASVREAVVGHEQIVHQERPVERHVGIQHADRAGHEQRPAAHGPQRRGLGAVVDLVGEQAVGQAVPEQHVGRAVEAANPMKRLRPPLRLHRLRLQVKLVREGIGKSTSEDGGDGGHIGVSVLG